MLIALALFGHVKTSSAPAVILPSAPAFAEREAEIKVGTTTLRVALAQTPAVREQGLSGRAALPEGKGMLFFFDRPDRMRFWMPDMHFAIDMVWIASDWKIVDISENATPESYPRTFEPKEPAQYVLEVPSGYAKKQGWQIGTSVTYPVSY